VEVQVFSSKYALCAQCGASVDQAAAELHSCDPERRADHVMRVLRDDIDAFETRLHEFLDDSHGRFETWLAARQVRRTG
jgi:hypothetical protein